VLLGYCLDFHPQQSRMYIHRCHSKENQQWIITLTMQLKSKGKCIVAGDNKLPGKSCNYDANQKFGSFPAGWALQQEGGQIKYKGKCLDYGHNKVYWNGCHRGSHQKWHYNKKKQIQSLRDPLYCLNLHAPLTPNPKMQIYKCNSGTNQQWEISKKLQLKSLYRNVNGANKKDLCIDPKKESAESCDPDDLKQRFRSFPNDFIGEIQEFGTSSQLKHDGRCLTYDDKEGSVSFHACNQGLNQDWYYQKGLIQNSYDSEYCLGLISDQLIINKCLGESLQWDISYIRQNRKAFALLLVTPNLLARSVVLMMSSNNLVHFLRVLSQPQTLLCLQNQKFQPQTLLCLQNQKFLLKQVPNSLSWFFLDKVSAFQERTTIFPIRNVVNISIQELISLTT